ncbi:GNAT family N-acetyltransferase [Desulfosporosinus sp. OT]|uniref:GNAT family N-acetyltransferase n=1 Tax=Desulfosporosinus sp. OT TaxID=913865 RepID=UPI000223A768|nr:GNAT family N-acetyltransferase [Desulfosporosinus sp. OT]EGW39120.1 acetyltransferase family protein [Desulfosporosinus sp. OT]
MEYFKNGSLNDLEELQKISQTAYVEAFSDLLNKDDVKEYIMSKYSLDNLKKEFEDMTNHFLLFYVGDKAVGYIKYILKLNSLEIDRLYMLKSYKAMGVGTKFMNKVEYFAKLNEKNALTLGVLEINKPAISFYEKRGFIQYSREAVFIGKTLYPLQLMKKELT